MARPSLYDHSSYRSFLRAWFDAEKAEQPSFTLAQFSRRLGFQSANYAGLVTEGKRNLTVDAIHQVAAGLRLPYPETLYFETLVLLEQATDEYALTFYRRRLRDLKAERPTRRTELPLKQLFAHWWHPVILVAFDRATRADGLARAQVALKLPRATLEKALDAFVAQGLLKEADGRYELNSSHQVFFDHKSQSVAQRKLLAEQLTLSQRALAKQYEKGGKFYAHTFTLATKDFPLYAGRVRELLAEFTRMSDESAPEEIAQLNVQLFSLRSFSVDGQ